MGYLNYLLALSVPPSKITPTLSKSIGTHVENDLVVKILTFEDNNKNTIHKVNLIHKTNYIQRLYTKIQSTINNNKV